MWHHFSSSIGWLYRWRYTNNKIVAIRAWETHSDSGRTSTHYKKKTHPWHFGPNETFFCHTYDTSMTIIVTKHGIIIDVVGSYFYDKKSRHKMGFSSWAGRRRSYMTFFGPSMTEKTMVEARARKISGCSRLRWVVGAERCTFLSYTHARGCEVSGSNWTRAIHSLLTEPERFLCCCC